mmetsp:Transcript_11171/g.29398  ORF Transcript_11171/g.29398 Transcript_11171/m.29398 type:complete len:97 (-) Transcript_11171:3153-3443(-)
MPFFCERACASHPHGCNQLGESGACSSFEGKGGERDSTLGELPSSEYTTCMVMIIGGQLAKVRDGSSNERRVYRTVPVGTCVRLARKIEHILLLFK